MTDPEKTEPRAEALVKLDRADTARRDALAAQDYRTKDLERDKAWHKAIVKRIAATFRSDKPGDEYTDDRQTDPTTYRRQKDGSIRVVNDLRVKGKAAAKAEKRRRHRSRAAMEK